MRIVLVGTELAPVHPGAGALETLLAGWAAGLAGAHDVTVVSMTGPPLRRGPAATYRTVTVDHPRGLGGVVRGVDCVLLNNRPGWQRYVGAPTLHLFHNWPDAWGLDPGEDPAPLVAGAAAAAVSGALASTVAAALHRPGAEVAVVTPFVAGALFDVVPRPEPGLVVSPNRLMVKKGVRELAAVADHPSMQGRRVLITDYLSPWTAPTAEHLALRATVAASAAELIAPPAGPAAMAALYARAEVVVCPSIRPEGLGLTAVEAQAVGVPVVSSGLGGLTEASLLPDLIADPADPAAFAAAITRAAAVGPDTRSALRAAIRARYAVPASLASLLAALARARAAGLPLDGASRPAPTG